MAEAAFGVQLRQSRQAAALSLRQLATRVGYDHSYLSQVERGQRPGSADLARLCDRELKTGGTLTIAYQQAKPLPHAQPLPPIQSPPAGEPHTAPDPRDKTEPRGTAKPLVTADHRSTATPCSAATPRSTAAPRSAVALPVGVDLLEVVRHGLVETFGWPQAADEWGTVAGGLAASFGTTPPRELLGELGAQLQLLPTDGAPQYAVPAAELGIMVALTLSELGQSRAAARWWRTNRAAADSSGERLAMSLVRGWEAVSGLAEHRPLGQLLLLAEEAIALADSAQPAEVLGGRAGCLARAHAVRTLGQQRPAATTWTALQDLLAVPTAETSALFDWTACEMHAIEGRVCAEQGYPEAGYIVLERALELCPPEHLIERAGIELCLAQCLMVDGEVAAGLALAMRVLVELPDEWHVLSLYDAGGRVLSAVPGKELVRPAVRDYRELLGRRPYLTRTVGSGSSSAWSQG